MAGCVDPAFCPVEAVDEFHTLPFGACRNTHSCRRFGVFPHPSLRRGRSYS
jgi:hypothetical protein